MMKWLLLLMVFFVSFTDAFSLGQWLKLWIVLAVLALPLSAIYFLSKKRVSIGCYVPEDLLIILMFVGLLVSSIINANPLSLNYIAAYVFIFGICYLYFKGLFFNCMNYKQLLNVNTFAVLFVSMFVVMDFLLWFLWRIDIQSFIPRSRETSAVYLSTFRRSYGFATEPTILAFYFNTLGVIGIWNLRNNISVNKFIRFVLTFLFSIAWLSTFSAVALAALPLSIVVCFFLVKLRKPVFSKRGGIFGIASGLVVVVFLSLTINDTVLSYFSPIYHKLSMQQVEQGSRPQRWLTDIKIIGESPVVGQGLGYATMAGRGSSVNWYLFLTVEGGGISSLPIILFLFLSFVRMLFSEVPGKLWFMSAFMAGSIHLVTISAFFHPFLWMLLIIFFTYPGHNRLLAHEHQTYKTP